MARGRGRAVVSVGGRRSPGAAMKIGQVLSTVDFTAIPEAEREQFKATLAALRDDVPPLPFSKLERLVRAELGGPVNRYFAEFEPEAFAAASIGQMHRAVTRDGDPVAVKVQYPGVAEVGRDRPPQPRAGTEFLGDVRRMSLPPQALLIRRMEGLVFSTLGELRASADWAAIGAEYHAAASARRRRWARPTPHSGRTAGRSRARPNETEHTASGRKPEVTEQDLPAPVTSAIDAVNAGDTDAFLSAFASDGWIDDNGRRFTGHDAMRAWSDRELIGADTRFEVTGSERIDRGVAVDIEVASEGFNGYSRFAFEVDGDALRSMTITA
jgi:ABC1 atypical kinase-like domain